MYYLIYDTATNNKVTDLVFKSLNDAKAYAWDYCIEHKVDISFIDYIDFEPDNFYREGVSE